MTSSRTATPLGVGALTDADPGALLALGSPPPVETDGGATLLEWLRVRRAAGPIWRDDRGHYHLFRHADLIAVVSDPATYSSDTVTRPSGGTESPPPGTLLLMDPPWHRTMRRLVTKAFSARRVNDLGTRIAELAAELLDDIAARTPDADGGVEVDLVDTFANPLPVTVIAELLGVPFDDLDKFQKWADCLLTDKMDDPEGAARLNTTILEMRDYLQGRVDIRRAEPAADLIGTLVAAEVDGRTLTDREAINFAALLLLAGHVTTAVLLGNTLLCLDTAPGEWAALRADPSRIPAVLEEVLRLRPPFLAIERVTTGPVELCGEQLPENAVIHLWLLSANRDERVFEDPDAFRPNRSESMQIAFGHGIHHCLGASLARMEGKIAMELMLERFDDVQVRRDEELRWHQDNVLGARHLPLRIVPSRRA
ncbi:cytochrome P450 [Nocardia terpenica]|uniref:Cytochrome P450 monooxygenase n=1 Tax=Nocardia terpenica TaxID=455432 RepID=A0A0U1Z235_9NOCA|nr:cytochrome P450 [Nocardia terpenica]AJO72741.1 Cytochrome P450 monooxygenase [Nocardia terpenica]NQE85821.1 cytochrome P450 [Nocardia terpenica]